MTVKMQNLLSAVKIIKLEGPFECKGEQDRGRFYVPPVAFREKETECNNKYVETGLFNKTIGASPGV